MPVAELMPQGLRPGEQARRRLLREMQRDQTHFAVVVDVDVQHRRVGHHRGHPRGDRRRDHRRVRPRGPEVEDLGDGRMRVAATMHVDDLAELFGVALDEDEVDTVGGLIGKVAGRRRSSARRARWPACG